MFCTNCGKQNTESAKFFFSCGKALSGGRGDTAIAQRQQPVVSLPLILKVFSVAFLILGLAISVAGAFQGIGRVSTGDTSVPALQNFSTALGGILVALYGTLILRRNPIALGRWWFLAAWPMNFLAPIGLFFLALIIASTLVLRRKHSRLFKQSTAA